MLKMTLMLLSNVKDRRWPYECNILKINKEKRQDPFPWQGDHHKPSSTATVTQLHSTHVKNLTWGGNVQRKDSNWCEFPAELRKMFCERHQQRVRDEPDSEWNLPPLLAHPPELFSADCNYSWYLIHQKIHISANCTLATKDRSILKLTEGENQSMAGYK